MAEDVTSSTEASSSIPQGKRKSCRVCQKFVYSHQPVIFCVSCQTIFHGKCLSLTNNKTFILQQISWNCSNCITDEKLLSCACCTSILDVYTVKFNICKYCSKISHQNCMSGKVCKLCSNVNTTVSPNTTTSVDTNNYYESQMFFSPFTYFVKTDQN